MTSSEMGSGETGPGSKAEGQVQPEISRADRDAAQQVFEDFFPEEAGKAPPLQASADAALTEAAAAEAAAAAAEKLPGRLPQHVPAEEKAAYTADLQRKLEKSGIGMTVVSMSEWRKAT
eukprot:TRINITY_DN9861_c0_g2_i1.p2 TRINITY_DN9861_c0_g2~~TRINITY_DN9861_c0_g2_i1.p2  ORF type:complete len:119 (-),score=40.04 TRINITY_DN9861_c0_g2_i1:41-397(-)